MHRDMGQPSLAEVLVGESLGQNARLERIAQAVDWAPARQVVAGIHAAREGRPSYPPLLMVKVLQLEQWYSLSDPQMEGTRSVTGSPFGALWGWGSRTARPTIPRSAAFGRSWRRRG